jgi:hypothetical protein
VRPPYGSPSSSFHSALRIPHSEFLSSPLNSLRTPSRAAPCTSVRNPGQIPPGRREEFRNPTRPDWFLEFESVRWRESDYTVRVNTGGQRVPTSELQRPGACPECERGAHRQENAPTPTLPANGEREFSLHVDGPLHPSPRPRGDRGGATCRVRERKENKTGQTRRPVNVACRGGISRPCNFASASRTMALRPDSECCAA